MLHKIVISKRAYNQFQSICDYLVDEFGERVADNFEFEVEQCVSTLIKFPEAGHPEPIESKYQYRSKIVGTHNKMYYFVRKNTLVIAAFADMRMHPDNVVKAVIGK
jgi:plasmid stabilization system protein ParE